MNPKLITWSDNLVIDNSIIDEQHQIIINLINELYAEFLAGKANETLDKIIEELTEYTVIHFQTEETFFERVNYSHKKEHIEEHSEFVNSISKFKIKLKKNEVNLSYDIMNFLRDWLQNHILVSDKKYIKYLKEE